MTPGPSHPPAHFGSLTGKTFVSGIEVPPGVR